MGKNQAYKAMQRGRLGSTSAGPEEAEDGLVRFRYLLPFLSASLSITSVLLMNELKYVGDLYI